MRISVLSVLENNSHYVKRVRIWSFSGSHFPAFGLNRDTPFLSIFSPNAGKYGSEKLRHSPRNDHYMLYFNIIIINYDQLWLSGKFTTLINHIFDEELLL